MYKESHWNVARWRQASSGPVPPPLSFSHPAAADVNGTSTYIHNDNTKPGQQPWPVLSSAIIHGSNGSKGLQSATSGSYNDAGHFLLERPVGHQSPLPAAHDDHHASRLTTPKSSPHHNSLSGPWMSLHRPHREVASTSHPAGTSLTIDIPQDQNRGMH